MRHCCFGTLLGTLAVLSGSSLPASPTDYTFTTIASTSAGTFTNVANPALNNNGVVAFNGTLDNGVSGIYIGANPANNTFVDNTGGFESFGRPDINDPGLITFLGTTKTSPGVVGVFNTNSPENPFVVPNGTFINIKNPVINAGIAFWAVTQNLVQGIYVGPNLGADTAADTTMFSSFNETVGPRIDNRNVVTFIASKKDFRSGVFTGPDDPDETLVDSSGLIGGFRNFDVNDQGHLFLAVQLDDETPALLKGTDPLKDALNLDGFGFAGDHLAINNADQIVFDGQTRDGAAGIFTGDDPSADRVIKVGDILFGQTVKALSFDQPGFNDKGQVAFTYRLVDDTLGIALATPRSSGGGSAVPLPSAIPATLFLLCALAIRSTLRRLPASMLPCNRPMTR